MKLFLMPSSKMNASASNVKAKAAVAAPAAVAASAAVPGPASSGIRIVSPADGAGGSYGGLSCGSSGGSPVVPQVVSQIWATEGNLARAVVAMQAEAQDVSAAPLVQTTSRPALRVVITPETAFYRKYTEAMLRRYAVMSLQKGRVPSLLGRELFRGKVTSHRIHGFDDMIHFVHDVDQCLKLLQPDQQKVVYRVAVQEYTFPETAEMLRWSLRSTQRRYHEALDELTAIFQKRELMEKTPGLPPRKSCQEGEEEGIAVTYSPA